MTYFRRSIISKIKFIQEFYRLRKDSTKLEPLIIPTVGLNQLEEIVKEGTEEKGKEHQNYR